MTGSVRDLTELQIEAFRSGRLRLCELARQVGVKPPTLSRYFKKNGITVGDPACPHTSKPSASSEEKTEPFSEGSEPAANEDQSLKDAIDLIETAGTHLTNAWERVISISLKQLGDDEAIPSPATIRQIVQNLTAAKDGLGIPSIVEVLEQSKETDENRLPELVVRRMTDKEEQVLRER